MPAPNTATLISSSKGGGGGAKPSTIASISSVKEITIAQELESIVSINSNGGKENTVTLQTSNGLSVIKTTNVKNKVSLLVETINTEGAKTQTGITSSIENTKLNIDNKGTSTISLESSLSDKTKLEIAIRINAQGEISGQITSISKDKTPSVYVLPKYSKGSKIEIVKKSGVVFINVQPLLDKNEEIVF